MQKITKMQEKGLTEMGA